MADPSVCVIIPTLNAEKYLPALVDRLLQQTVKPTEILIVDSQSDDATCQLAGSLDVRLLSINRSDFDHGGTRNEAVRQTQSDYILFMSQDALPVDNQLIEKLLASFAIDGSVAAAYARQVPYGDADAIERQTRGFNYPSQSRLKSRDDVTSLGIKTYFFSDVCSLYSRSCFEEMGGFESPILTNEDMLMAYHLLNHGYKTYYQSEAEVYHSHHFTLQQHYRRNFDVGAFLAMHPDLSCGEMKEGIRMVMQSLLSLLKQFRLLSVFQLVAISFAKWKGNRDGRRFQTFTFEEIVKKSAQKCFWLRFFNK